MSTTGTQANARDWSLARLGWGSSVFEMLGGMGVIVLAIIGLAGVFSMTLAAIATILVGISLLYGNGMAWGFSRSGEGVEEGFTPELLAGLGGVVLGILGLFGISPTVLLPAAVIAFGAALLMSGGRFQFFFGGTGEMATMSGGYVFAGLVALVLGILGVIGLAPAVLTLVALLTLGVAGLLTSGRSANVPQG